MEERFEENLTEENLRNLLKQCGADVRRSADSEYNRKTAADMFYKVQERFSEDNEAPDDEVTITREEFHAICAYSSWHGKYTAIDDYFVNMRNGISSLLEEEDWPEFV